MAIPAAPAGAWVDPAWLWLFMPPVFVALAVIFQSARRDFIWVLVGCAAAYAGMVMGSSLVNDNLGTVLGTALTVIYANLWAKWTNRPESITLLPAIIVLVSGAIGFQGSAAIAEGQTAVGTEQFVQMFIVALAIGGGVLIANTFVRPRQSLQRSTSPHRQAQRVARYDGPAHLKHREVPMSNFSDALNSHIANEFAASQQYIAIAAWYDDQTLPQLAAHFYRQAVEERNHAMMIVQYLLDADATVTIPGVEAPKVSFDSYLEPVQLALEQEREVTRLITDLAHLAREEGDLVGEQFLAWFLTEQREEEASMADLVRTVERAGETNILLAEDYLSRNPVGDAGAGAGTPEVAGGAL